MKKCMCYYLLVYFLFLSALSFSQDFTTPKRTVICGKIINPDSNLNIITFNLHSPPFDKDFYIPIDKNGCFYLEFDIYTPIDGFFSYKTWSRLLIHPDDSLHISFKGNVEEILDAWKSIEFSGKGAQINQEALAFEQLYRFSPLHNNSDENMQARKKLATDEYHNYADSIHKEANVLLDRFIKDNNPSNAFKEWAKIYLNGNYHYNIIDYPGFHMYLNKFSSKKWKKPENYEDYLLNILPLNKNMLINGSMLSRYVNTFHYKYVRKKMEKEDIKRKYIYPGGLYVGNANLKDSIFTTGIIKHTPDSLLRQMILTEYFEQNLNEYNIESYEKNKEFISQYITEPFLYEPLYNLYIDRKNHIDNTVIYSQNLINASLQSSAKEIIEPILEQNKNKIVYVDFWGTWCGACKLIMKWEKKAIKEIKKDGVVCVYICLDSKEKEWKKDSRKLNLGKQNYFANKEQSKDLRRIFEIQGAPYYMLIDENGVIVEKGSHLSPYAAKRKIEELKN